MKINWRYLKKPSVIIGAIVLFFILLFLLNRSASASTSGTTTVSTGPSDAELAAQSQYAIAQLGASVQGQSIQAGLASQQDQDQTQIALATIAAAVSNAQTAAQQAIATQTVDAQVHGLDLQYQTAIANNNAQIKAMQVAAGSTIAQAAINANLQAALSANQLAAFKAQSMAMAIGSANPGDRDQLTAQFIAAITGTGVNYEPGAHGSAYVPASGGNAGTTSTIVQIPTNFLTPVGGLA